jgi:hypothetical protein
VILYVFFLDYYVSGLTAGAIKEIDRCTIAGGCFAHPPAPLTQRKRIGYIGALGCRLSSGNIRPFA